MISIRGAWTRRVTSLLSALAALLFMAGIAASAQGIITGGINGTVTDQTGVSFPARRYPSRTRRQAPSCKQSPPARPSAFNWKRRRRWCLPAGPGQPQCPTHRQDYVLSLARSFEITADLVGGIVDVISGLSSRLVDATNGIEITYLQSSEQAWFDRQISPGQWRKQ
jgi:hypothetical protein